MKKHYNHLWLLLLAAFGVFAVLSAFEIPSIAGYSLKSAGIYDALFASAETSAPATPMTNATEGDVSLSAEPAKTFPFPCDTASQVILLIGDSMLEGLGPRLAAYAEENGHTLYTVIWYSSTSERWGQSDKLKNYINQLKPTFIFLSLGGNELFVKDIAEKRDKYVKKIIAEIGNIPYVWIGPPNWKKDTGINDLIRQNTPEGAFFLSDGMTFQRSKDGAHPTRESAALWMDSIVRWMPAHALHPIRLDKPTKKSASAKRVFMHRPDEK